MDAKMAGRRRVGKRPRLPRRLPGWPSTLLSVCRLYTVASVPGDTANVSEAWQLHADYVETGGNESGWNAAVGLSLVAAALARAGLADSARTVMAHARRRLPSEEANAPYFDYFEAYVATLVGDTELALELLARFIEAYPSQREFLPADWWFRPLWDDPRFRALMDASPSGSSIP